MRRALATVCCLVVAASCVPFGGDDDDAEAIVRRFVEAWHVGGAQLTKSVRGDDTSDLVEAVASLKDDGVARVTLVGVTETSDRSRRIEGTVALHFADEGQLLLTIRAIVDDGRVRAEPSAVAATLTRWEQLRIDAFGVPMRGDILSRGGSLLAQGSKGSRVLSRTTLAPAVALVDDALDVPLGGKQGRRLVSGRQRVLAESSPADGDDVRTSLDDAMQVAAEATLGTAPGALVAVDPRTGGIRALASNPERQAPDKSPATSAYSPGSAFKIVTAAAALDNGVLEATDIVPCPSQVSVGERVVSNFENLAYGSVTFEKAFAVSCNTAFAQIGMTVDTNRLLQTARGLGFRVAPELDGPSTIAVPRSRAELGVWSFGAAGSLVTPLHLAGVASTIASGGTWVEPRWTDGTDPGKRVLRERTATALVAMMEAVVETGTGRNAAVPGAHIAGKTGTAEPRRQGARSDAWFVGLAPSRGTRVAVVGFLPAAGIGGDAAAPLVRNFLIATAERWGQTD